MRDDIMKLAEGDMRMKRNGSILPKVLECDNCKGVITYDELLSKYGPEGLYEISKKLIEVADQDVSDAMGQCGDNLSN